MYKLIRDFSDKAGIVWALLPVIGWQHWWCSEGQEVGLVSQLVDDVKIRNITVENNKLDIMLGNAGTIVCWTEPIGKGSINVSVLPTLL
jgi:hypothetical protein